jgi:ABC-type antimicrobial peptide transport system permease subunit
VHQIIVRLPVEPDELGAPVSLMRGALDLTRLEVMPWNEILPELKSAIDAKRRNQSAIFLVVFLIVALGVLNTMTMSTFERIREFGVLASLGTRRRRILAMVVLEALMQGAIGFAAGVLLSWAFLHGIGTVSLSGLTAGTDVMGVRMPEAFRLSLHVPSVISSAVVAAITVLAGGLIPAIRAARLKPVEATRYV